MAYKSNYNDGGETDAAHYIVEIMCERRAKKENRTLIRKFWQQDYWKQFYVQQLLAAHSLLKLYSEQAILAGIKHPKISWAYSLRTKQLQPFIAEEQRKIDLNNKLVAEKKNQPVETKEVLEIQPSEKPRQSTSKNSTFQKLRDL